MRRCAPLALVLALAFHSPAHAQQIQPTFVEHATKVIAIINLQDVMADCGQHIGRITVSDVQFSSSGSTLELIKYLDSNNRTEAIPTKFGDMSNAGRRTANDFIKTGRSYFVHTQTCGSGGFVNLVSIYDVG